MPDYADIDITFARLLTKKIIEEIEGKRNQMETGTAQSHEQTRHTVGYLRALRDVIEWGNDIGKHIYND